MGEAFLHGQGSAGGGGEVDTRFKDLIEGTLTEIDDDTITSIDGFVFYKCLSLTSVNFPLATSIGNSAFDGCSKLTSVNFPLVTSIGSSAFNECSSLTSVNFPLVTSISTGTISYCSSLTSVDFPLVTSIGGYAFRGDSSLTSLILRTTTQVCSLNNKSAFWDTPMISGTGYIYVPSALIEDYKAATNWSTYAAQFRALEDYTIDGTVTGELDPTKI